MHSFARSRTELSPAEFSSLDILRTPLPKDQRRPPATPPRDGTRHSNACAAQNDADGAPEYLQIEPQGPIAHILRIKGDVVVKGGTSARLYLPQARKSRRHRQSDEVVWVVLPDLRWKRRPRSDEAHFAPEHVEQLRDLVEAVLAKYPPESRYSGVVGDLEEDCAAFIARQENALQAVGVGDHRSEFVHREWSTVPAYPRRHVENWTVCLQPDQKHDDCNQWRKRQQERDRHNDVEQPLACFKVWPGRGVCIQKRAGVLDGVRCLIHT